MILWALWHSSGSSQNTVDLVTSWKRCCVIAWFVAAETNTFKMASTKEMAVREVRDLQQTPSVCSCFSLECCLSYKSSAKKSNHCAFVVVGSIFLQPASSRLSFAATVISKAITPPFALPRFEMLRRKHHQLNPHINFKHRTTCKSLSMHWFIHLHLTLTHPGHGHLERGQPYYEGRHWSSTKCMVVQSRGHKLAEFNVWEQESQAIHPEIHFRRE